MVKYTARLENWRHHLFSEGVQGIVYGDIHRRFDDGESVITSAIKSLTYDEDAETGVLETRNSVYQLGKRYVASQN